VSNRNAQVIAIAGAAALAGFGYTLARRSGSRAARSQRASSKARLRPPPRPADSGVRPAAPTASTAQTAQTAPEWQESERISSSPDALDLALDLDGVFDGKSADGSEVTAQPNQHVPAPRAGDDDEAPSPEDLGRAWLTSATESEHSLGFADTLPEIEQLRPTITDLSEDTDSDGDGEDDDETTAEYVRRHRISSAG